MEHEGVKVYVWREERKIPSFDYKCLQVLSSLEFCGVEYERLVSNNPIKEASNEFPILRLQRILTSYDEIMNSLKEMVRTYQKHKTTEREYSETLAYECFLRDKLYPALDYMRWLDDKNYIVVTSKLYAATIPFPFSLYYPWRYRNQHRSNMEAIFPHLPLKELQTKVYNDAVSCLQRINDRLGEFNYMFGDRPSHIDALIYGCIAQIVTEGIQYPTNPLCESAREMTNVVNLVKRVNAKFFANNVKYDLGKISTIVLPDNFPEPKFPNKIRNQIFWSVFVVGAMIAYSFLPALGSLRARS